jgi:selenium-binding protein 1
MALWKPDPTFYPSPRLAMDAPAEKLPYVVAFNPNGTGKADKMTVVDVDPQKMP